MNNKSAIWAVVPAAGIGSRMGSVIPKQYLLLDERPVLAHVLERLLSVEQVTGVIVSLNEKDEYWKKFQFNFDKSLLLAPGGKERSDSVLNALEKLEQHAAFDKDCDWVLVHDAVRPCVQVSDIENLINTVDGNEAGGLLATPVRDTMKRQDDRQAVAESVDREGLWHALTPQLFNWKNLFAALIKARESGCVVTDESSAMEQAGYKPVLVPGSEANIKVTRMDDLRMAELIIKQGI